MKAKETGTTLASNPPNKEDGRQSSAGRERNRVYSEDSAAHNWYRFVLSFPPHLVREYIHKFSLDERHRVLDPFCGTGTTTVECKKLGIASIGVEANPMAHFASQVKVEWGVDPDGLLEHARQIADASVADLYLMGIEDDPRPLFNTLNKSDSELRTLPDECRRLLLTNSISPLPEHKTLVLLQQIKKIFDDRYYRHEILALAQCLVHTISNLHFGPEVGVGPAKKDAPVVSAWLKAIRAMAKDLHQLRLKNSTPSVIHRADSRHLSDVLEPGSIDAVITSPPYPNEKDYTRTTRLESVFLGFIRDKKELQALKRNLVRSNTRNVYKEDDDHLWISDYPEIERIAQAIEERRIELGKTSGFERLYAKVTKLYFGGLVRHLSDLRTILRPGAQLAYVVGDQASYLRVMIRTGELLSQIALSLGYELCEVDLFRTRLATATKEQLREEVVVLRWPG